MSDPPTGMVTFLFTDIEGSTPLWEQQPLVMSRALSHHNALLHHAIEAHHGHIFKIIGDAFQAAFAIPHDALAAAVAAQRALQAEPLDDWDATGALRVRMGLHVGRGQWHGDDYAPDHTLNRVARVMAAGHGGQILVSRAVAELLQGQLPANVMLRDLGEHRLKGLSIPEHLYQAVVADLPADFPALNTLDEAQLRTNLPIPPSHLIGREKELTAVETLLQREAVRLVTLTGPGGSGKTRLSLEVASHLLGYFADGIYFVNLTPISDPNLVVSTIARTLNVREQSSKPLLDSLKDYLHHKQVLLLLDNFEQVVKAASSVAELLAAAPQLKVLITSRAAVRLRGEKELIIPPLTLPSRQPPPPLEKFTLYEAVRLFIERAQEVKPDFIVTSDNAPAVAEICHRLDGLPLAIELAAMRIKMLSPQAMLPRLEKRLKLLTSGPRDVPDHQRTLRSTIEWSYELLDESEKILFRRLAIFIGGRTLEAVEAVCNVENDLTVSVLDGVEALLSKSLLRQEEGLDGEPRLVMLETIHEYAWERLEESGEIGQVRRAHADYFLALVEEAEPELSGMHQAEWLQRLEVEHDNLRAVLRWAQQSGDIETGLRLAGLLWHFWEMQGHFSEGRGWLEGILKAPQASQVEAAWRAKALTGAGTIAWHQANYKQAIVFHEQALALYRILGDKGGAAFALNNIGAQALVQGDYEQASPLFEEGLALARELGDNRTVAMTLHNLADVARHRGEYAHAAKLYNEGLWVTRQLGDIWVMAAQLTWLGVTTQYQGAYHQAKSYLHESLSLCKARRDRIVVECLEACAGLAAAQGQSVNAEGAARLLGGAETLRHVLDAPIFPAERADYERTVDIIRRRLDETRLRAAWAEGQTMTLEETVAYAFQVLEDLA